jgi:hypothetical protein
MVEGDSARHPCVVVVGDTRDDLVAQTLRLTSEYEVDVTRCDDVYAAVAALAVRGEGSILLVGRFRDLAREDGRLFALAARNGTCCCSLLDSDGPAGPGDVLAAIRAGVSFVGRIEEVEPVLEEWLTCNACRGLTDDEYRATEAELNALLERRIDG